MAHDLYETDFPVWAEEQASRLRARGAGLNGLDYDNLAEEVGDLGASWNNQARSHVRNIIRHLYKLAYSPAADPRHHWRSEILTWRADVAPLLTGSVLNRLRSELDALHRRAFEIARADCRAYGESIRDEDALRWTLEQIAGEVDDGLTGEDEPVTSA